MVYLKGFGRLWSQGALFKGVWRGHQVFCLKGFGRLWSPGDLFKVVWTFLAARFSV